MAATSLLLEKPNLSLMFIGMSGIGKTEIANKFDQRQWFHYSIDYRIGTKYLIEPIIDEIKREMIKTPYLHDLLRADAITLLGNLSVNNLFLLSQYIGMLGSKESGGLEWETFISRQRLHLDAETAAVEDIDAFRKKAQNIYGYEHFIIDSSGSICEVPMDKLTALAEHTLIIYIKAPESLEQELIHRAQAYPKPLYYNEGFLEHAVHEYQAETSDTIDVNTIRFDAQVFARWILPKLITHRLPKYQRIADELGITIPYEAISQAKTAEDVLSLCRQYA